ncbi:MAG TPA: EamA family transporter [Gemmatimonadaceae bacterium]|nr:EamA family transporter [Gemmatimonadaceae bacterium]
MTTAHHTVADAWSPRARRLRLAMAFASVYLFWGGTFLAIRYAVAEVPPLLTIAIRCAGGAALLYAWLWWRGAPLRATRREWRTAAIGGALLFLGCHALLARAEQRVSSGQAALVRTAIPIWMVLLEAARARRRPTLRAVGALALGTAGVAVLTLGAAWSGRAVDAGLLLLGALAWAAGSLIVREGARPAGPALATAMQLAAGAVCVLAAAVAAGEPGTWQPAALTLRGASSLAFLVVCGTVLGFGAYSWLLRATSPLAASSYAFVNPVVALLLGWAVSDDVVSARTVVATVLVVGAVALTRSRPRRADDRVDDHTPGRRTASGGAVPTLAGTTRA